MSSITTHVEKGTWLTVKFCKSMLNCGFYTVTMEKVSCVDQCLKLYEFRVSRVDLNFSNSLTRYSMNFNYL